MFALWDGHWDIFEALELSLWNATEPPSTETRPEVAETRALALSQIALNSETLEPEVVFRLCVHAVRWSRLSAVKRSPTYPIPFSLHTDNGIPYLALRARRRLDEKRKQATQWRGARFPLAP